MSVFAKRLKEARLRAGLSQERVGMDAGLDAMSASTRMNRYELGLRSPNFELVERIAGVLNVPTPFFYASDDMEAELILGFSRLRMSERRKLLDAMRLTATK